MNVNQLIKKLSKLDPKAKIAVDVSYNKDVYDCKYMMIDLDPRVETMVEMHENFVSKGKPKYINMCVIGTIVGNNLE